MAGTGACTATMLWRKAHAPFSWSCGGNVVSASLSAQWSEFNPGSGGNFFTSHRLLVLGKPHEIGLFTIFMFSGLGMGQAP